MKAEVPTSARSESQVATWVVSSLVLPLATPLAYVVSPFASNETVPSTVVNLFDVAVNSFGGHFGINADLCHAALRQLFDHWKTPTGNPTIEKDF